MTDSYPLPEKTGDEGLAWFAAWIPMSQKRNLHPKDEDLPLGTPDRGHPQFLRGVFEQSWHELDTAGE
jgi:hypothetical protein